MSAERNFIDRLPKQIENIVPKLVLAKHGDALWANAVMNAELYLWNVVTVDDNLDERNRLPIVLFVIGLAGDFGNEENQVATKEQNGRKNKKRDGGARAIPCMVDVAPLILIGKAARNENEDMDG